MDHSQGKIRIAPRADVVVLDPDTRQAIPMEGIEVPLPLSTWWTRRLADGDVQVVQAENHEE